MKNKEILRIVLSSPGDVKDERRVMEKVVEELNRGIADDRNLRLELGRWETDAYPGFHVDGPQGFIDQVLKIEDCDILIGIFWKRFGTPTKDALSGTEHEIRKAIKCWEQSKQPQIMIYFKEDQYLPQTEEELDQHKFVLRFRKEFPKEGLYWTFEGVSCFERLARNHLSNLIRSKYKLTGTEASLSPLRTSAQLFIRDYCRQIRKRFSTVYLFGSLHRSTGASETALDRMTSIEQGFVPLHLSDWHESTDRKGIESFNIKDLFFDQPKALRFLVRGLPGGGKTTLMHYLSHYFATLGTAGREGKIPVYIRLRNFNCTKRSLEEFVRQKINEDSDSLEMRDTLCDKKRFLERSMVLLLDGLDEIEDSETHDKIAELLDEFARSWPRCTIIVTSRPIGLQRDEYPRYRPLDLLPLNSEMVDDYLDRWFAGNTYPIVKLQKTFRDNPRIRSLAANPFLLSMICFTFWQGGNTKLVERRSELYENCTRYLLNRPWDPESKHRPPIDYEHALEILKDLSLRFFLWQEADFAADHVNIIGRNNPSAAILGKTEEFLDRLQRETGLIQCVKEGYTFIHRSLWEYFTALSLLNKKRNFVIRHAANPDWEEVIRLYAGLLSTLDDVEALVKGLWTINRPLALRVTTEIKTSPADIIQPLIEQEEGNQGKLLLIDSLEQSLPLVAEAERQNLVQETLRILLLECDEKDCQVIYNAHALLEQMRLEPLQSGGLIYEMLDLAHAADRQKEFLADPANHFEWIEVQGGVFWMGDDDNSDARPVRRVKVDSFRMAKHPVTNRLFSGFPFGEKNTHYVRDNNPDSQKSSQRLLKLQERKAIILTAPWTVPCIPDCFNRCPITVRQPASSTPVPIDSP